MTEKFDDRYFDVLESIGYAILRVYGAQPELADFQVDKAVAGALRVYQAQGGGRTTPTLALRPLEQQVYDEVKQLCDWWLAPVGAQPGSEASSAAAEAVEDDTAAAEPADPVAEASAVVAPQTVEEIVACLKRIRKSVSAWTKKGGRQGYLTYISEYVKQQADSVG